MNLDTFIDDWIAESDVCLDGMNKSEKAAMKPVLMCLCDDLIYYRGYKSDIDTNGPIVEENGKRRPNPAENMRHKCITRILNESTKIARFASKAGLEHLDKLAEFVR